MLKELFSNRLFIGALAFFILSVVGGTLYISHVEKQGAEELATDEDRVKQPTEKQQQSTAKAPVGDTSQGGHFHEDRTWHGEPHEAPVESPSVAKPAGEVSAPVGSGFPRFHDPYFRMMDGFAITSEFAIAIAPFDVGPDFTAMSDEELAAAVARINSDPLNLPEHLRPPNGYHYPSGGTTILSDGDNIWLDDNGHPILQKNHTPFFEIIWSEGFRPPPDVYADYKVLHKRYMEVFLDLPDDVSSPELERIDAEMDAMMDMYRGPVPNGNWVSGTSPSGTAPHTYFAQFGAAEIQMQRYAFEKAGIAYLMDRYASLKEFAK